MDWQNPNCIEQQCRLHFLYLNRKCSQLPGKNDVWETNTRKPGQNGIRDIFEILLKTILTPIKQSNIVYVLRVVH